MIIIYIDVGVDMIIIIGTFKIIYSLFLHNMEIYILSMYIIMEAVDIVYCVKICLIV